METEGGGVGSTRRQRFNRVKAAAFLVAIIITEKLADFIVIKNFISYITDELHETLNAAAEFSNYAEGIAAVVPVAGAIIAHVYVGRRLTMTVTSSVIYIMGLSILVMTEFIPTLMPNWATFILSTFVLYLGIGVLRPYLGLITTDQFDKDRPREKDVWTVGLSVVELFTTAPFSFVLIIWGRRDTYLTLSLFMVVSIIIFYRGKSTYRYVTPNLNDPPNRVNLRMLLLLWITCVVFGIFKAQSNTLFAVQSTSTTRVAGHGIEIPPVTFYFISFIGVKCIILFLEKIILPIFPTTHNIRIPILTRMVFGMLLTVVAMMIAAIIEKKRLAVVLELAPKNKRDIGRIPFSMFLIVPQGMLLGLVDTLFSSGLEEYFSEHPHFLSTIFYTSAVGSGSCISGLLIRIVDLATRKICRRSWFGIDLNSSRIDNFYWFLMAISIFGLIVLTSVILIISRRTLERTDEEVGEREGLLSDAA